MPRFSTVRRVRHSAQHMFDLVADVERYPEFLPLCQALTVRRRRESPDGRQIVIADMRVGYMAVRETFTSQIVLDRANSKILVEYLEGPFSSLENRWSFEPDPGGAAGCAVHFFIDYEFRNRMLGRLMGSMFDSAFRKFSEAFERRADRVYGAA